MNFFKRKLKYIFGAIRRLFNPLKFQSVNEKFSTSLSDNQVYPEFCLKASNDLAVFDNFRRSPAYRQILEHVNPAQ